MGELSIKVNIADREYPLTIESSEEENVRKAVKKIAEKLKSLEKSYAIRNKQDLLAMCALQLTAEKTLSYQGNIDDEKRSVEILAEMEQLVTSALKN